MKVNGSVRNLGKLQTRAKDRVWDTGCNFNGFISNQSIFNCLITGASTLYYTETD